jgi:phenylalanyl-tRNA synthetase beta chain
MLHPRIPQTIKYSGNIFVFELNLNKIRDGKLPEFKALSKFPIVTRDLSVVVDESVSSQSVRDCVGQCTGDVLKNLELFDVYHGEGIDSGKKSVTLSLTFQASSHTLNDEEVESLRTKVMEALGTELGASLRG